MSQDVLFLGGPFFHPPILLCGGFPCNNRRQLRHQGVLAEWTRRNKKRRAVRGPGKMTGGAGSASAALRLPSFFVTHLQVSSHCNPCSHRRDRRCPLRPTPGHHPVTRPPVLGHGLRRASWPTRSCFRPHGVPHRLAAPTLRTSDVRCPISPSPQPAARPSAPVPEPREPPATPRADSRLCWLTRFT